jgi:hypothetical protein
MGRRARFVSLEAGGGDVGGDGTMAMWIEGGLERRYSTSQACGMTRDKFTKWPLRAWQWFRRPSHPRYGVVSQAPCRHWEESHPERVWSEYRSSCWEDDKEQGERYCVYICC